MQFIGASSSLLSVAILATSALLTAGPVSAGLGGGFIEAPGKFKETPIGSPWISLIEKPKPFFDDMVLEVPSEYPTIQAAVDAAVNGDYIQLKAGHVYGAFEIHGKHLTVRGPYPKEFVESGLLQANPDDFALIKQQDGQDMETSAIKIASGSLTLENVYVTGWTNGSGGGIWALASVLRVKRSVFANNHAYGEVGIYGGAVSLNSAGDESSFQDCVFWGNTATPSTPPFGRGHGGCIHASSSPLEITNCHFYDSTAGNLGGAINARWANVKIQHSLFSGNEARLGSAICVPGDTQLSLVSSAFYSNHALTGGTISLGNNPCGGCELSSMPYPYMTVPSVSGRESYEILNCEFSWNEAWYVGGAALLGGRNTLIDSCSFTHNVAEDGGAIYNYATSGDDAPIVRRSKFCGNTSRELTLHPPPPIPSHVFGDIVEEPFDNCYSDDCHLGESCYHRFDFDFDGDVDSDDRNHVMWLVGTFCSGCPEDADGDGEITWDDVAAVEAEYTS